nr:unnamed protein product [Digitaria exilis]
MAKEAVLVGDLPAAKESLLLLLLLLVLLRHMFITGPRRTTRPLPPSPPWLPLIGHVHLVGALPHVSLRRLAERYGGLMTLRLGVVPTLVASSTRAAQAVLRAHDRCFASRPSSVCGDVLSYGRLGIALAPYGEGWRQAKKLAITHLLNASKVQSYRAAREEEVALVISKIRGAAATGTAVDMSELLSKFTSDMVCRAVAGRSFRVEGRDRVFRELIDESNALLAGFNLDNLYPGLATAAGGVLVRSARTKAERVWERWDRMIDKQIDEHATVLHEDQDCDFIHMLLSLQEEYGLTRDAIKAIVVVRSSIPKGQNTIFEDNLVGMTYLKAVVKETLRLHPPSPLLLPWVSLEDCDIESFHVPAGTSELVNVWAIGRDPKEWDAAEEFMPERFIQNGEVKGIDFRGKDFQLLPFGSGRRMCPGINFALASIELMLANLIYHFDWKLPKGVDKIDMTEVFLLTVSRKEKLRLVPM